MDIINRNNKTRRAKTEKKENLVKMVIKLRKIKNNEQK